MCNWPIFKYTEYLIIQSFNSAKLKTWQVVERGFTMESFEKVSSSNLICDLIYQNVVHI